MTDSSAYLWESTTLTPPNSKRLMLASTPVLTSILPSPLNQTRASHIYVKPYLFTLLSSSSSTSTNGPSAPRHGIGSGSGRSTPSYWATVLDPLLRLEAEEQEARRGAVSTGASIDLLAAGSTKTNANGAKNLTLAARSALEKWRSSRMLQEPECGIRRMEHE